MPGTLRRSLTLLLVCCSFLSLASLSAQNPPAISAESDAADLARYDEILKKQPKDFFTRYYRGNVLRRMKQYDRALEDFNRLLRDDPTSVLYLHGRAEVWSGKGEYDKAIEDLSKGIETDPKSSLLLVERGFAWQHKGNLDRALTDFTKALQLSPDSGSYVARADVYRAQGKLDEALNDYNQAIKLYPFHLAYAGRGRTHQAQGKYKAAVDDFSEAVRLEPKFATGYNDRAWLLATCSEAAIRDGKSAVAAAIRACELTEWKNAAYVDTLAAAYAENGEFESAVTRQEEALKLLPADSPTAAELRERLALYREKKPHRK